LRRGWYKCHANEAIRFGQILKFINIRVRVSGGETEVIFKLRQVCERKGNRNTHNTLCASHLSEGVEGNGLDGGSMRASVWGAQRIQWF
jgi:hypothetical protein